MKRHSTESNEPLGIVVADGGYLPQPTFFSAFVWGPVPEEVEAVAVTEARELELAHS